MYCNKSILDTVSIGTDYGAIRDLLCRFQQEKLYLVGHSWGSVLGLLFIQKYPEYIYSYIGCGQVVNMEKSCKTAYEYAMENANKKERERLKNISPLYNEKNWMSDLLYTTKLVIKYKGSLFGKKNYNRLILPFIFCKEYSLKDLINRVKGGTQSIKLLWEELMKIDFENVIEYKVPVIFIEGRYDKHVSSNLVEEYYEKLKTDKELIWFERSCHFPQWSESEKFNQTLINIADKTKETE